MVGAFTRRIARGKRIGGGRWRKIMTSLGMPVSRKVAGSPVPKANSASTPISAPTPISATISNALFTISIG